ncbi:hypothetical protein BH24GEM1_BH24GEM1_19850 [soil metagenome]
MVANTQVALAARGLHKRGWRRAAPVRLGETAQSLIRVPRARHLNSRRVLMTWTKPEAEVVAVTMEVTAYVSTL